MQKYIFIYVYLFLDKYNIIHIFQLHENSRMSHWRR